MKVGNRITPTSIKVNSGQWRPWITYNDSIRIYHRNEFDYVIVENSIILSVIQRQFTNYVAHYKASVRLSCMKPCLDINALPFPISERAAGSLLLGEGELVHIEASDTLRNHFLPVQQIVVYDFKVFPFFVFVVPLLNQFLLLFKLIFKFRFLISKLFLGGLSNVYLL